MRRIFAILISAIIAGNAAGAEWTITQKALFEKYNTPLGVQIIEHELEIRDFNRRNADKGLHLTGVPDFALQSTDFLAELQRRSTVYGDIGLVPLPAATLVKRIHANSVALIIFEDFLPEESLTGNFKLIGQTLEEKGFCPDRATFRDEIASGICTGFLIAPDVLVTASHCVQEDTLRFLRCVFDYKDKNSTTFNANQVFNGQIIDGDDTKSADWTRVRLMDKNGVIGTRRPGLSTSSAALHLGQEVYSIGYPEGTSIRMAEKATIRQIDGDQFVANLDVFAGNSGSPIFNLSDDVIGFLRYGEQDWIPGNGCMIMNKCPDDGCIGEFATSITVLPPLP